MKKILLMLCILYASVATFAQKNLKIGDTVPDLIIRNVINYKTQNTNLKGFKDKLLILDFGFTHCPGCVEKLPEMAALQKKYGENFQFFWVTYEPKEYVANWFRSNRFAKELKGLSVPTITGDKLLNKLFSHSTDPHEIWILDNKVVAITDADLVTEKNISEVILNKKVPDWSIKEDIAMSVRDSSLMKFSNSQIPRSTSIFYSCIVGPLPNMKYLQKGFTVDTLMQTRRWYGINLSITELYYSSAPNLFSNTELLPSNKSVILEVKDKGIYDYRFYNTNNSLGSKDAVNSEWGKKYNHSYEAVAPMKTSETAMLEKMRQDLNYYFNANGRQEERIAQTWVIKLLNNDSITVKKHPNTDWHVKDQIYSGMKVKDLAFNLNDISAYETPIYVDESGYNGMVNLNLEDVDINYFVVVKAALNKQGFDLTTGERKFNFLVITENNTNQ